MTVPVPDRWCRSARQVPSKHDAGRKTTDSPYFYRSRQTRFMLPEAPRRRKGRPPGRLRNGSLDNGLRRLCCVPTRPGTVAHSPRHRYNLLVGHSFVGLRSWPRRPRFHGATPGRPESATQERHAGPRGTRRCVMVDRDSRPRWPRRFGRRLLTDVIRTGRMVGITAAIVASLLTFPGAIP